MSPEQAMGEREITPKADIYALGCVLYEMLTAEPPFVGATAQAIIARVMTEEPRSLTLQRRTIPPHVEAAVRTALEKLPADRFASAAEFAAALGNTAYASAAAAAGAAPRSTLTALPSYRLTVLLPWSLALLAAAGAAAGWMRRTPEPPLRRFDLTFGAVTPVPNTEVVISPDGSMIAIAGRVGSEDAIYLRRLDGDPDFRKLAGTETGSFPAFSPDNQWIVFRKNSDRSLVRISVGGGGAVTLVPGGTLDPYFPQWGTDNEIVFVTVQGGFRVAATGGAPVPMRTVASRSIFPLPDGSGVLHTIAGQVALYDVAADSSVVLIPGGTRAVYVPTGHILYHSSADGGLFAVPFDLRRRRVQGTPVRVLERVGAQVNTRGYAVSASGVLVQYDAPTAASSASANHLVIVDPGRGADTVRVPSGRRAYPRFSRDARFVAMEGFTEGRNGQTDIYTLDLVTGTYSQLTFDGDNDDPAWSPDGRWIAYDRVATDPSGEDLFIKPADNSAPERRLTTLGSGEVGMQLWLDDRTLLFDAVVPGRATDVFTVATDSGSVPVPYLQSPFDEREPWLSPDRRMLAFVSNETGSNVVWMRDFPAPQGKWNVSRGTARAPRWSPDGRFVYFWRVGSPLDTLFRARIERTPAVVVHAPEMVAALNADGIQNWDLHPDGRRFIVAVPAGVPAASSEAAQQSRYLILQNWFEELRRLTAVASR
jgi:serine/threonine-protein kinase